MMKLWVDGGTGPGNGSDRAECYGSYYLERGRIEKSLHSRHPFPQYKTNNEAEYQALLLGIDRAWAGEKVEAYSDSRLIVQQVNGRWKCKEPRLQTMLGEVWATIARKRLAFSLTWVPREQIVKVLGH